MKNKIFGYLGISARARKVATGETAMQCIKSKSAKVVFLASDSSLRTQDKVRTLCTSNRIHCIEDFTSEEISDAIGQVNRMSVAVLDEGLANQILKNMK